MAQTLTWFLRAGLSLLLLFPVSLVAEELVVTDLDGFIRLIMETRGKESLEVVLTAGEAACSDVTLERASAVTPPLKPLATPEGLLFKDVEPGRYTLTCERSEVQVVRSRKNR